MLRHGALACDFGQDNDDRQADQAEQNTNRNPTDGFGSLSVMGRFKRMRRLCVLHVSVLSKKEASTCDSFRAATFASLGDGAGRTPRGTPERQTLDRHYRCHKLKPWTSWVLHTTGGYLKRPREPQQVQNSYFP
jgi:hypothetical protein